jgi:hypothetical protein
LSSAPPRIRIRRQLINESGISLSLWCGCGSGSYLSIWCGSGSTTLIEAVLKRSFFPQCTRAESHVFTRSKNCRRVFPIRTVGFLGRTALASRVFWILFIV